MQNQGISYNNMQQYYQQNQGSSSGQNYSFNNPSFHQQLLEASGSNHGFQPNPSSSPQMPMNNMMNNRGNGRR